MDGLKGNSTFFESLLEFMWPLFHKDLFLSKLSTIYFALVQDRAVPGDQRVCFPWPAFSEFV